MNVWFPSHDDNIFHDIHLNTHWSEKSENQNDTDLDGTQSMQGHQFLSEQYWNSEKRMG